VEAGASGDSETTRIPLIPDELDGDAAVLWLEALLHNQPGEFARVCKAGFESENPGELERMARIVLEVGVHAAERVMDALYQRVRYSVPMTDILVRLRLSEPEVHLALLWRTRAMATQGADDLTRVLQELRVTELLAGVTEEDSLELAMERAFSCVPERVAAFKSAGAVTAEPAWGRPSMNVCDYPRGQYDEDEAARYREEQYQTLPHCSEEFRRGFASLRKTLDRRLEESRGSKASLSRRDLRGPANRRRGAAVRTRGCTLG
jgi:hypothetical protein